MKITYYNGDGIIIDLDRISDSELFEELEERGYEVHDQGVKKLIDKIYYNKKLDKPIDKDLEQLIDLVIARIA